MSQKGNKLKLREEVRKYCGMNEVRNTEGNVKTGVAPVGGSDGVSDTDLVTLMRTHDATRQT